MHRDDDTGALIAQLSRAWADANPRKAAGGAHALSGFGFQFSLALLEILEKWKNTPGDRRAVPNVFVELLSDVVSESFDRSIVVSQVKRTQTPAAIRTGLDDLASVYEVAAAEIPRHIYRLDLELAFRTGRPEDAWPAIEKWVKEDPDVRGPIARKVSVNLYPDPENRIFALLVNGLNDPEPVAHYHRWLGELMAAAGQPTPAERHAYLEASAKNIWAAIVEIEKLAERRGGVYLWSPTDRLPDQVREGDVLTGQQPSVAHLRKGSLAPRPEALGRIRSRLDRWLAERAKAPVLTTVPLFWIGGRSGSGKSALLLQLLSALQEEGAGPVLWLADRSELLADGARWARDAFDAERPVIIGLDDPYAPNGPRDRVWGSFLAELTGSLQAGEGEGVPILVCAGPTEQAEAFERDFSSDFDIEVFELEREQPAELVRLRDWYEQRTGAHAPGVNEENVLLVQLFFEWRAGVELSAFAHRFRRRLTDADPEDGETSIVSALAEVLALNRLYVGYPSSQMNERLSDSQTDVLDRLRDEEHIAIDEDGGRSGVWLSHPHLANEIYEAWFPRETSANQRRGHFVEASVACLNEAERFDEKTAPIRAVMQALGASGHILRDRIDPEFVAALPELYEAARGEGPEMSIDQLGLWLEVQQLTDGAFDPDPVEEILPRIGSELVEDASALRLCEALLSSFGRLTEPQRERLAEGMGSVLAATPDWTGWPRVAAAAARTHAIPQLPGLINRWLGRNLGRYSAGRPLLAALAAFDEDARFEAHALRLLREYPRHSAWGRTWMALWRRGGGESLVELAIEWLKQNGADRSWTFVWRTLAAEWSGDEGREIGLEWIELNSDHPGWSVVWSFLWRARPSASLEALALPWLDDADVNRDGFGVVWCDLWDSGLDDEDFRGRGEAALRRMTRETNSWVNIVSRLLWKEPSDEVWQVGMTWLEAASPADRAWGSLLAPLLDAADQRQDELEFEAVSERGYRFLRNAHPSHPGWSHVFGALWLVPSDELRSLGRSWLGDGVEGRRGWTFVWQRLWEDEPAEWLVDLGFLGLRDDFRVMLWANIWSCLCEEGPEVSPSIHLAQLLDLGEAWIEAAPADSGWTYVFRALWERRSNERVRRLGMERLAATKRREEPAWDRIWAALWEDPAYRVGDDGEALQEVGVEWLQLNQGHAHWTTVWCALWDDGRGRDLRKMGEHWLENGGADNPRRRLVSGRLAAAKAERVERRRAGRTARRGVSPVSHYGVRKQIRMGSRPAIERGMGLVRVGPASGRQADQISWMQLWRTLWRVNPTEELREIAVEWLESSAETDSRGRSYVWEALWKSGPSDELYGLGCDYLDNAPYKRSRWPLIWRKLWWFEETSALHRLAVGWLDLRFDASVVDPHSEWPRVWTQAFEGDPTPELADLARRWLRACPEHRAAPHLRRILWEHGAPEELSAPGLVR